MNKTIIQYILIILVSFALGFFMNYSINSITGKYECKFQTSEISNIDDIITIEKLDATINSKSKFNNISSSTLINNKEIEITQIDEDYILTIKKSYFTEKFDKKTNSMIPSSSEFISTLLSQTIQEENILYLYPEKVREINTFNPYFGGGISSISFTLIFTIFKLLNKNNKQKNTDEYRGLSLFSKEYWINAKSFLSKTKHLATISMILGLLLISKMIKIPTGFSNLGFTFGFLFFSIIGLIYGPFAGLLIGLLSDILGYFLFDTSGYAFNFLYVLQAMVSGLLCGLFLYKKKITFLRLFTLRLFVGLICNVLIGTIAQAVVANFTYEQAITYMSIAVIPKNIIFLMPQSILLYLLFKLITPVLSKYNYIDDKISKSINLV